MRITLLSPLLLLLLIADFPTHTLALDRCKREAIFDFLLWLLSIIAPNFDLRVFRKRVTGRDFNLRNELLSLAIPGMGALPEGAVRQEMELAAEVCQVSETVGGGSLEGNDDQGEEEDPVFGWILGLLFEEEDWSELTSGEREELMVCSEAQEREYESAMQAFGECTGANQFFNQESLQTGAFLNTLESDCILRIDSEAALLSSIQKCFGTLLGDAPLGRWTRQVLQNLDLIPSCLGSLQARVPSCLQTVVAANGTVENVSLEATKQTSCVASTASQRLLQQSCEAMLAALDDCLPQVGAPFRTVRVSEDCEAKGVPVGILESWGGIDMMIFNGNRLPAYCTADSAATDVSTNSDTSFIANIEARFDYFNQNRRNGFGIPLLDFALGIESLTVGIPGISFQLGSDELSSAIQQCDVDLPAVTDRFITGQANPSNAQPQSSEFPTLNQNTFSDATLDLSQPLLGLNSSPGSMDEILRLMFNLLGLSQSDYNSVAKAFADPNESPCTSQQEQQVVQVMNNYQSCTSYANFIPNQEEETQLLQNLQTACETPEDSPIDCLDASLGSNPLGNYIRYTLQNLDMTFECFANLQSSIPSCASAEATNTVLLRAPNELNLDTNPSRLSMTFIRQASCIIGEAYPAYLEKSCTRTINALEICLPQINTSFNSDEVSSNCQQEGIRVGTQSDLNDLDISIITNNAFPNYCLTNNDQEEEQLEQRVNNLVERYNYYNANRDMGWSPKKLDHEQELYSNEMMTSGSFLTNAMNVELWMILILSLWM